MESPDLNKEITHEAVTCKNHKDASAQNLNETPEKRQTSKWSLASFIFAVLSIPPFCFIASFLLWWLSPIVLLFPILSISFAIVALVLIFKSKGKLKGKGYAITVLTGAVLIICIDFALPLLSGMYYVMTLQNVMQFPFVYKRAGRELAQYCRVMESEVHDTALSNGWYPPTIRLLHPFYGYISPQKARITFTGGFYHLCYIIELDPNSSNDRQTVWNMSMISESSPYHIYTFTLDKEDEITFDEFIEKAVAGYDKHPRGAHSKIIFLLLFNRPQMAYEACQKLVKDRPTAWWPRLTLAFMDAARTSAEQAGNDLTQWVAEYPCFTHYFYLSFFYQKENDLQKACDFIEKSLEYPLKEDVYSPDSYSIYSCASESVTVALKNGRTDLALKMCDAALAQLEHEHGRYSSAPYWKPKLQKLRAAIVANDQNTIDSWNEYQAWGGSFNPYQDHSTNAIQRIKVGNHFFPSDEDIKADERPYEEIKPIIEEWQADT